MLGATVGDEVGARTVASAAEGDAQALAAIVARYHDDMARVCAVICSDPEAAADAVQSAWPIAWRSLRSLRDPDRLRPWLISIAANQARQQQRRDRRRRVVELRLAEAPSHRSHDDEIALADLGVAVRRLAPDDRALLALRYVAGLTSNELAETLGISPSGVRSRLERLLARLRVELGDV